MEIIHTAIHVLVSEELNKFGLIPEFIGRFPIVFRTEDLTKQEMKQVLTQIDNNLLEQSKFYFELDNIQLEFSDKVLDKIVDLMLQYKVGARVLKGIVEATLLEYHFEADPTVWLNNKNPRRKHTGGLMKYSQKNFERRDSRDNFPRTPGLMVEV